MFSEIIRQLKTVNDVDILKEEIDILMDGLYKSDFKKNMLSKIRSNMIGFLPQDEEGLSKLLKLLGELKILKLTLAISPTPAMIDDISTWVKKNVGQDVVLDIKMDESIIAGAQISLDGKYGDYSLKPDYEQFCEASN